MIILFEAFNDFQTDMKFCVLRTGNVEWGVLPNQFYLHKIIITCMKKLELVLDWKLYPLHFNLETRHTGN